MEFQILDTKNKNWNDVLLEFGLADPHYSREYALIFERESSNLQFNQNYVGKHYLAFFTNGKETLVYPIIKREISILDNQICDLTSPYGYGGPLIKGNNKSKTYQEFRVEFEKWCKQNDVVTEFSRLHPLSRNHEFVRANEPECVRDISTVYYLDLRKSWDTLYSNFKKRVRTYHKKRGLLVEKVSITPENAKLFAKIYSQTMDRISAESKYHFTEGFFINSFATMKDKLIMILAKDPVKEENLSSLLILQFGDYAYYWLSATADSARDRKYSPTYPSLAEAIKILLKSNTNYFLLGGGYRKDDSLAQFKRGFSQDQLSFYIYSKIHNQKLYDKLNIEIGKHFSFDMDENNYFPKYRLPELISKF